MAGPIRATQSRASSTSSRQPPRPLNAWIIYRKDKLAEMLKEDPSLKRLPQSEVSKRVALLWKTEKDEIRARYEYQANLAKAQHQEQYPDYQFKPQKRADKERQREERRAEKEKEKQQRRNHNKSQSSTRQASSSTTPVPPSTSPQSQLHLAELASKDPAEFHGYCTTTYGPYGPSPPVSQCPSPDGSPVSLPRSLPTSSESERSRSRPPQASSSKVTPPSQNLSPLELISALHNASSPDAESRPEEDKPQPDAPIASSSTLPSWAQPQQQARPSGHASSLAAGPSGFAAPDASVTQAGNGFTSGTHWSARSDEKLNGAHVRQDAIGLAKDGYSETYGQGPQSMSQQPHNPLEMSGVNNQWEESYAMADAFFNFDNAPLQGELSSTGIQDIFTLTVPTATLGDGPPGEIEVQSGNFFAQYQQQFEGVASGSGVQQDTPTMTNEQLSDLQMYLQQFGVLPNSYGVHGQHGESSNATIMNPAVNLSGATPPSLSINTAGSQGSASAQSAPTPPTPASVSDMQGAQPLAAIERDLGMEPFIFPQDAQHAYYSLPTPPKTVSPTAHMNFSQLQSTATSPSFAQPHDFEISIAGQMQHQAQQHRPQSSWGYHIAHPQVSLQSQTQPQAPALPLATPGPSPTVPAMYPRRMQQGSQHQRAGSLVAAATAGMRRATNALFPATQMAESNAPSGNVNANVTHGVNLGAAVAPASGLELTESDLSGASKNAQVPVRKIAGQWRVARSS